MFRFILNVLEKKQEKELRYFDQQAFFNSLSDHEQRFFFFLCVLFWGLYSVHLFFILASNC